MGIRVNKAIGYGIYPIKENDKRLTPTQDKNGDYIDNYIDDLTDHLDEFEKFRLNRLNNGYYKYPYVTKNRILFDTTVIKEARRSTWNCCAFRPYDENGANFLLFCRPDMRGCYRHDDPIDYCEHRDESCTKVKILGNFDLMRGLLKYENIPVIVKDLAEFSGIISDLSIIEEFKPMIVTWWE